MSPGTDRTAKEYPVTDNGVQPDTGTATTFTRRVPRWPAIAAAVIAGLSAAISMYWALGGTAGIATIGGAIEGMARSGKPGAAALAWGATLVKAIGVIFALALICRFGRAFPRRLLLVLGWLGAGVLAVYGAVLVVAGGLVVSGIIAADASTNLYALRWHLFLWDPLFLLWGLLLGGAVRVFQLRRRPTSSVLQ